MPPHPRMALVQALLVRALVARFWDEPYAAPLVRWGTELHDRFLLPYDVAADIGEVVDDLAATGSPFELAWLAPFLEFRFPRLGAVDGRRRARSSCAPRSSRGWCSARRSTGGGTARYVDSSVERLQVHGRGPRPRAATS